VHLTAHDRPADVEPGIYSPANRRARMPDEFSPDSQLPPEVSGATGVRVGASLAPLAVRDFRLLFLAQTVSLLGNAAAPVALAFAVLDDLDGSASDLGIVLAAAWVPQIALTLFGGVWADRLPRHLVMVASDLMMFAAQATAAALLLTGTAEIWHLIALQFVRGGSSAFFFPASTGLVPLLVRAAMLQQANALLLLAQSSTAIVGAACTGLIVAAAGPGWAVAFDAGTFLASAALLAHIRIAGGGRVPGSHVLHELREGWDEFRSRTWLWTLVLGFALGSIAFHGGFVALGPVVADNELGGAAAWGYILAGAGLGLFAAGVFALRFKPERLLLVGSIFALLSALPLAALALAAPTLVIVTAAAAAGFGVEFANVLWYTSLHQHIPEDRLSRVASYDDFGSFLTAPLGLAIAGPVSEAVGISATLWAATGLAIAGCLGPLASRQVRRLRRTDS
jgi:predicted MFS family arabinose efflux permease